jgi:exodeoxyribonuclease V alpha subunit
MVAVEPLRGAVLEAVLERITYANDETGYTIARVDTGRGWPTGSWSTSASTRWT